MDDRDRWGERERESGKSMLSGGLDDDDDDDDDVISVMPIKYI